MTEPTPDPAPSVSDWTSRIERRTVRVGYANEDLTLANLRHFVAAAAGLDDDAIVDVRTGNSSVEISATATPVNDAIDNTAVQP